MSNLISIKNRVQRRLRRRINDAFGFMVATAWASLFDDIFSRIVGDDPNMFLRIIHALVFTVIAALATMMLDDEDDD